MHSSCVEYAVYLLHVNPARFYATVLDDNSRYEYMRVHIYSRPGDVNNAHHPSAHHHPCATCGDAHRQARVHAHANPRHDFEGYSTSSHRCCGCVNIYAYNILYEYIPIITVLGPTNACKVEYARTGYYFYVVLDIDC